MKRRADSGGDAFERAMGGVEPLDDDVGRVPNRRRRPDPSAQSPGGFAFERVREGLCQWGWREGVATAAVEALRAGKPAPENRLDLHGMTEEAAREAVSSFVRQAQRSGLRCVAVVHGRGLRSADGPVLKNALPRWLTQLPLARNVAAFASAPREQGGDGVTLVLLAG